MKQKYLILKNKPKNELIIREFAELKKESFSLLCEETFEDKLIKSAIAKGREALIFTMRTKNMYPHAALAAKMAEEVISLYESYEADSIELFFDDMDILTKAREAPKPSDNKESGSSEIYELLEDDAADSTYDENESDDITYPIKVADDDSANADDEE